MKAPTVEELSQFMSLVSAESQKIQKIKEEKEKKLTPKIDVNQSLTISLP